MTDTNPETDSGSDDLFDRCYPLNVDSPHVAAILNTSEKVRFFLVDLSGLDAERIGALLPIVRKEMDRRHVVPVFVTDLLDYREFRDAGVIFEALPPVSENSRLMPERDWAKRRDDVMALIREKWQPAGETALNDAGIPEFDVGSVDSVK